MVCIRYAEKSSEITHFHCFDLSLQFCCQWPTDSVLIRVSINYYPWSLVKKFIIKCKTNGRFHHCVNDHLIALYKHYAYYPSQLLCFVTLFVFFCNKSLFKSKLTVNSHFSIQPVLYILNSLIAMGPLLCFLPAIPHCSLPHRTETIHSVSVSPISQCIWSKRNATKYESWKRASLRFFWTRLYNIMNSKRNASSLPIIQFLHCLLFNEFH